MYRYVKGGCHHSFVCVVEQEVFSKIKPRHVILAPGQKKGCIELLNTASDKGNTNQMAFSQGYGLHGHETYDTGASLIGYPRFTG